MNLTYIAQGSEPVGDGGDKYTGLDRFGRVIDQRWLNGSGVALDRIQYGFDRASSGGIQVLGYNRTNVTL